MMLLTITGPSCAGKDKLMEALVQSGDFRAIRTITTRPRRTSDDDGRMIFVSEDEFELMIERSEIIEANRYGDFFYGTPLSEFQIEDERVAVKILEPVGLANIDVFCQEADVAILSVYVSAPTEVLIERWLKRMVQQNLSPEVVAPRLSMTVQSEIKWRYGSHFDFVLDSSQSSPRTLAYQLGRMVNMSQQEMLVRPTT